MKINKYAYLYYYNGDTILYNSENGKLILLTPELKKIYLEHVSRPSNLLQIHPEFYNVLETNRFIISKDENEAETLIHEWEKTDDNPAYFGIIINPTLNCNMRCWYCYEKHEGKQIMKEDTRNAICRLIEYKTTDPQLKTFNVSFFGGEPLLLFEESVFPILQFAAKICKEKGIVLYSNFTTNSVLLTDDIIERLNTLPLGKKVTFQITLDGNRELHDKIRVGVNKKPTYDTILQHIQSALQHGNEVSVRLNYTYDNILTFYDVLEDFKALNFIAFASKLVVKFEHVWQDGNNLTKSRPLMRRIRSKFEEYGYNVGSDDVYFRHTCYADSPHHIVINYNGDIFKCTARDFIAENREGKLTQNGDIEWNEKFSQRMAIKYSNQACRDCIILPICNGSCTQNKLESGRKNVCFVGMNEKAKESYLKAHIEEFVQKKMKYKFK